MQDEPKPWTPHVTEQMRRVFDSIHPVTLLNHGNRSGKTQAVEEAMRRHIANNPNVKIAFVKLSSYPKP